MRFRVIIIHLFLYIILYMYSSNYIYSRMLGTYVRVSIWLSNLIEYIYK